jgi:hypothetical protein
MQGLYKVGYVVASMIVTPIAIEQYVYHLFAVSILFLVMFCHSPPSVRASMTWRCSEEARASYLHSSHPHNFSIHSNATDGSNLCE